MFVAAVQELAANPRQPAAARDRIQAALAEWDRHIRVLEAQNAQGGGPAAFERHISLGLTYHRRGRLDDALKQFDAAAGLQAGASDVHLLRALTLEAAARGTDAGGAFHAAWTRDPDNPAKAYLVLTRTGDLDATDRARATAVLRRAFERVLSGSYRPAGPPFLTLDAVPDALARTPVVGEATLAGVFARLAAGRLDDAVAAFDGGNIQVSGASALARGRAAEAAGRFDDARREYAIALGSTLAGRHSLHVGMARLAQVQGDQDAALAGFGQAARLSPNDPVIRRELAAAYMAAGRTDDAFAELVAALLTAPDDAAALAAVGQLFLDTDRATEAIPALRRALAVRADRYETHYALAVALSRSGQADEAASEFARFEQLSRQALEARRRAVAGAPGPVSPMPPGGGGGAPEGPR